MSGDTSNARIWLNADVLVAAVASALPDWGDAWGAPWSALGLLSEDGMGETRDQETTDHYAYGGILVRTTRSKQKRSFTVVAMEDNDTVFKIRDPGSEVESAGGGVYHRTVKVPTRDPRAWGLEKRDGLIIMRRHIPLAEVTEVGERQDNDAELALTPLTVNVYPDADGVLYHDYSNDPQWAPASA